MSPVWKFVLPLAVVLPLAAFVVGSLTSAADDEPPPRQPIVLHENGSQTPGSNRPRLPRDDRPNRQTEGPVVTPSPFEGNDEDNDGDDDGDDDNPGGGDGSGIDDGDDGAGGDDGGDDAGDDRGDDGGDDDDGEDDDDGGDD